MKHYIFQILKLNYKKMSLWTVYIFFFLVTLFVAWLTAVFSSDEFFNNKDNDTGNGVFYDLENLFWVNFQSLNTIFLTFFSFLIFSLIMVSVFFSNEENGFDILFTSKNISRRQMLTSKLISFGILIVPIFFIDIIPILVGVIVDASTAPISFFPIIMNLLLQKLLIVLFFVPIFIFLTLIFKSKISFLLITILAFPTIFISSLMFPTIKQSSVYESQKLHFATKESDIVSGQSYAYSNPSSDSYLTNANYAEWKNDLYSKVWGFDVSSHISRFGTIYDMPTITNSSGEREMRDGEKLIFDVMDTSKLVQNTDEVLRGQFIDENTIIKIDNALKDVGLDQIRDVYLNAPLSIDLVRNTEIDKQNFLILKESSLGGDGQSARLLTVRELFNNFLNGNNIIINGKKVANVEEMALVISLVKYEQFLPDYFVLHEEINTTDRDLLLVSDSSLESYINDWLLFIIYPLNAVFWLILSYSKFQRKDFK